MGSLKRAVRLVCEAVTFEYAVLTLLGLIAMEIAMETSADALVFVIVILGLRDLTYNERRLR
jgi:hypothetical protein